MKVLSEKDVQTQITKYVTSKGGYVVKVLRANSNGVADLLMCLNSGIFVACEVKAEKYYKNPEKQMSAWQHKHADMVRASNGLFVCPSSLQQFKDFLEDNLIYL